MQKIFIESIIFFHIHKYSRDRLRVVLDEE